MKAFKNACIQGSIIQKLKNGINRYPCVAVKTDKNVKQRSFHQEILKVLL